MVEQRTFNPSAANGVLTCGNAGGNRPERRQSVAVESLSLPERQEDSTMHDPTTSLDDQLGVLRIALAQWEIRDNSKAQPEIRQAANTAMTTIDDMLAGLHRLRSDLVTEIRQADHPTAARSYAMLTEGRARQATVATVVSEPCLR
jgi:hypothetical protein